MRDGSLIYKRAPSRSPTGGQSTNDSGSGVTKEKDILNQDREKFQSKKDILFSEIREWGFATVYTEEKIIKDNHNKQNIQQREACIITGASKNLWTFSSFL